MTHPVLKHLARGLLILSALVSVSAQADLGAGVLLGGSSSNPKIVNGAATSDGGTSFVYGAYGEYRIVPMLVDLEVGLLLNHREMSTRIASVTTTTSYKSFQSPILFKFVGFPFLWAGVGPFTELAYGDAKTQVVGPGVNRTTETRFNSAGLKRVNWGLVGAFGLAAEWIPMVRAGVEMRYVYGLRDLDSNLGTTTKTRELQWLARAGFSF